MKSIRIYRLAKTAMQSGHGRENVWIAEFPPRSASRPDTLMGWSSSDDTQKQVRLEFESLEAALSWAKHQPCEYVVEQPQKRRRRPKSYAENFSSKRSVPWTH